MTSNDMKIETYSDEDWLSDFEVRRTIASAKKSNQVFDHFCQSQVGLNGESKPEMISKYQEWINQDKPDIRSICISLNKFVKFMAIDHPEICT